MRNLNVLILIAVCSLTSFAQNEVGGIGSTAIKVSYAYHGFTLRGYEIDRPMILVADTRKSKFYNPMTNWIDSINSTPEGKAKYEAMQPKVHTSESMRGMPARWEKMYVEKNRIDNFVKEYDTIGDERYYSKEPIPEISWVICDSTKTILGYECMEAMADFRGRHWTVFFAPEIPLSEGPWKLSGLPGLILEAKESCGQYSYTADAIQKIPGEVPPVYQENLYEPIDRKEMLKFKREFTENFGAIITAQTSGKNLRPSQFKSLQLKADLDFLETDYR